MLRTTLPAVAMMLGLVGVGCGSDDNNNNAPATKTYTISGAVTYSGTMPAVSTSLTVSADTRQSPVCNSQQQDMPVVFKMYQNPTFPMAYELADIKGGSYYVFSFFNTDTTSGMCPGVDDICAHTTTPLDLSDANAAPTVNLTLDIVGCQVTP